MPFGEPLQLERVPGTHKFKLLRDFVYFWENQDEFIVVPKDYITDQASVPKWVLPLIVDNTGKITDAAVPHDYGYTHLKYKGWSRAKVDRMFYDAMLEAGMKKWRARIAYAAVRMNIKATINWSK